MSPFSELFVTYGASRQGEGEQAIELPSTLGYHRGYGTPESRSGRCAVAAAVPKRVMMTTTSHTGRSAAEHATAVRHSPLQPAVSDLIRVGSRRWFLQTGLAGL